MKYERLAFDSNAAVDFFRAGRASPNPLRDARTLYLPLYVLAELKLGASRSHNSPGALRDIQSLVAGCHGVLAPDEDTVEDYIRIRNAFEQRGSLPADPRRKEGLNHDLWIAALCVQHKLPLLTNDRDFDGIEGLQVVHW